MTYRSNLYTNLKMRDIGIGQGMNEVCMLIKTIQNYIHISGKTTRNCVTSDSFGKDCLKWG